MPLSKTSSEKSLRKNIETEIAAGKSPKQAAAIAYSVQRKARAAGDRAELVPVLESLLLVLRRAATKHHK